jgi:hypothetical protein
MYVLDCVHRPAQYEPSSFGPNVAATRFAAAAKVKSGVELGNELGFVFTSNQLVFLQLANANTTQAAINIFLYFISYKF